MSKVAIVDHGLGNLFSVKRAFEHAGLQADITADRGLIQAADGIVLPGVGAFGDAMTTLNRLDLVLPLIDSIAAGTPFMGICLGVQLLMSESYEFGHHKGLGVFEGTVERFENPRIGSRVLKVPEICWNQVEPAGAWGHTPLAATRPGEYMYFVHSYYVKPVDQDVVLSTTTYGHIKYCSSLGRDNVFACQFHPERSGVEGLKLYQQWAQLVARRNKGAEKA